MTGDEYLAERGWMECKDRWGLEVCGDYIRFPVQNAVGSLVGAIFRVIPGRPGLKFRIEPRTLRHQGGIFGLPQAVAAGPRRVIIVEGQGDVVTLSMHGFPCVVAMLAPEVLAVQAREIAAHWSHADILMDGDAFGEVGTRQAMRQLGLAGVDARPISLPKGVDPDAFARDNPQKLREFLMETG